MIELAFASDRPQTKRYLNHECERTKTLPKDLHFNKLSERQFSKNHVRLQPTFAGVLNLGWIENILVQRS